MLMRRGAVRRRMMRIVIDCFVWEVETTWREQVVSKGVVGISLMWTTSGGCFSSARSVYVCWLAIIREIRKGKGK